MSTGLACLLVLLAASILPSAGMAEEKAVTDVKELAGTWRGWVTATIASPSTMIIKADGSYQAAAQGGPTTVGQYYLADGKLRYRSSRSVRSWSVWPSSG